ALMLVLLAISPTIANQINESRLANSENKRVEILKSPKSSDLERANAIQWLLTNKRVVNFDGNLRAARFSGGEPDEARFIAAQLDDVRFTKTDLPSAVFSLAKLRNVQFVDTKLKFARFDEGTLEDTEFSRGTLYRSIFDRAVFCGGVQFTDTDVRLASFRDVVFVNNQLPRFTGTAWWLATGWSMDEINQLRRQSAGDIY